MQNWKRSISNNSNEDGWRVEWEIQFEKLMAHQELITCNMSSTDAGCDLCTKLNFKQSGPKIMAHYIGHESSPKSSRLDVPPGFKHLHPRSIAQHVDPMMVEAHLRNEEASFIDENRGIRNPEMEISIYLESDKEERVPLTPLAAYGAQDEEAVQIDTRNELVATIPDEEDLIKAQVTWGIGKEMGLRVNDEGAMLKALSKVKEVQDFNVTRKRGRPKKQSSQTRV